MWVRRFDLRVDVVVFEEEGAFVAQGLQYDIAEQGPNVTVAKERFAAVFVQHVVADMKEQSLRSHLPDRAPRRFWDMLLRGRAERLEAPLYLPHPAPRHDVRAVFHVKAGA